MSNYKCLKLLYLYVKITLYYVRKSKAMYEYHFTSNQANQTQKIVKQSNATSWSSQHLDLQYLQIRDQIMKSEYYKNLQKQAKIRINGWINKLDRILKNCLWKKNRNNYAKLLNLMCQCEVFIAPFTALPPHSDISTLTKHEINAIIDQVELTVKNNTLKAQNWFKEQLKQSSIEKQTPKQYWSRVRQIKQQNANNTFEQSSIKQATSIDFASKYTEKRVKNSQSTNYSESSIKSMPLRVINLSQKQNIKVEINALKKCDNSSDHKSTQKQLFENRNISKINQNKPIQLKVKFPQSNSTNLFNKNKRIATNHTRVTEGSDTSFNFRDHCESIQMADGTVQSQLCQNQSYQFQNNKGKTQMNESNLTYHNLQDEFSQRCRNKQEVLIKNYFSWKKISPIIEIKQNQVVSSSDSILSNQKDNNFTDTSKAVQMSHSYQKHYWESDSVSGEFNYRQEGQAVQINLCEQQQIGEEGPLHLSNHLQEHKSS